MSDGEDNFIDIEEDEEGDNKVCKLNINFYFYYFYRKEWKLI